MWIRTTQGRYVNTDNVFDIAVMDMKRGDFAVAANTTNRGVYEIIAMFNDRADAQDFLDKFMKKCGQIAVADMGEWNYRGHQKTHKETRRGGS